MRFRCLVMDHDDTTVNSTATIHFPSFLAYLKLVRPEASYTLEDYFRKNFDPGIMALFTGELLGKSVTTARLLTLLCGVGGVENVHLTAPAADVAVGSTELPMLGTVTISELTEA